MIISRKHKFLYLQTKKTASVSIALALGQIADPKQDIIYHFSQWSKLQKSLGIKANAWKRKNTKQAMVKYKVKAHSRGNKLFSFIRPYQNDYFKFTIERNPGDKVVSLYFYFKNAGFNRKKQERIRKIGFDDYIKKTELGKTCYNWPTYTDKDEIVLDYIGKYENLKEELEYIESRIGISFIHLLQEKANANFREDKEYRKFYNDETKKIIADYFQKEINYFGYEF